MSQYGEFLTGTVSDIDSEADHTIELFCIYLLAAILHQNIQNYVTRRK